MAESLVAGQDTRVQFPSPAPEIAGCSQEERRRSAKSIIAGSIPAARSLTRRWSRNKARLAHNQEIIRCDSGLRYQFEAGGLKQTKSRRACGRWLLNGEGDRRRSQPGVFKRTTRRHNARLQCFDPREWRKTADALGLNPGCCEFESRLPH